MSTPEYIRWFGELGIDDVALVGGKNASLGELYRALTPLGVNVPNGFAVTAQAFRDTLTASGAWPLLEEVLAGIVCKYGRFIFVPRWSRRFPAQVGDLLLNIRRVLVPVTADLVPEQVVHPVFAPRHLDDDRLRKGRIHYSSSSCLRAMKVPTTPCRARPPLWATVLTVVPTRAGR